MDKEILEKIAQEKVDICNQIEHLQVKVTQLQATLDVYGYKEGSPSINEVTTEKIAYTDELRKFIKLSQVSHVTAHDFLEWLEAKYTNQDINSMSTNTAWMAILKEGLVTKVKRGTKVSPAEYEINKNKNFPFRKRVRKNPS